MVKDKQIVFGINLDGVQLSLLHAWTEAFKVDIYTQVIEGEKGEMQKMPAWWLT